MVRLANGVIVTLVNYLTRECLDLAGGSKNDNTPIIGYECTGATNQQWELVENLTTGPWAIWSLHNVATGTAMDLVTGPNSYIRGYKPQSGNAAGQNWRIVSADPEYDVVMIQNTWTNTYATLLDQTASGGHVIAGQSGGIDVATERQLWVLTEV